MENGASDRKYAFFSHKECEYFPCHATENPEKFNCLFCYCPLYTLGEKCGGDFRYTDGGIKDCSNCLVPHTEKSLDYIMSKWNLISSLTSKK